MDERIFTLWAAYAGTSVLVLLHAVWLRLWQHPAEEIDASTEDESTTKVRATLPGPSDERGGNVSTSLRNDGKGKLAHSLRARVAGWSGSAD